VNYDGTFVCSALCVYHWIFSQPKTEHPPAWAYEAHVIRTERNVLQTWRRDTYLSKFEGVVASELAKRKLDHSYETLAFEVADGKIYIPDFLVRGHWCLLETKGKWALGQKAKMKLFVQRYPEIPLLVIPWIIRREFGYGRQSGLSLR
jgi:hypothetical protein